jgi:hypothetical protein
MSAHKTDIPRRSTDVRFLGVKRTSHFLDRMSVLTQSGHGRPEIAACELTDQPHFASRKSLL